MSDVKETVQPQPSSQMVSSRKKPKTKERRQRWRLRKCQRIQNSKTVVTAKEAETKQTISKTLCMVGAHLTKDIPCSTTNCKEIGAYLIHDKEMGGYPFTLCAQCLYDLEQREGTIKWADDDAGCTIQ